MGGECYRYAWLKPSAVTAWHQAAYIKLQPVLLQKLAEWKHTQASDALFEESPSAERLLHIKSTGPKAEMFSPIKLPVTLPECADTMQQTWRLGWQHRSFASYLDP